MASPAILTSGKEADGPGMAGTGDATTFNIQILAFWDPRGKNMLAHPRFNASQVASESRAPDVIAWQQYVTQAVIPSGVPAV